MRACISLAVACLAALPAFADEPALDMRGKAFQEASEKAMASCAPAVVTGVMADQYGDFKSVTRMVCKTTWSGGCADGKADGPGESRNTCESTMRASSGVTTSTYLTLIRGTMVRGKLAGLYRTTSETGGFSGGPPIRTDFYRFADGHPPDLYVKDSQGNYQPALDPMGKPAPKPAVTVAEMDRMSGELIADARKRAEGGTIAPRTASMAALDDLLPGGRVQHAEDRKIRAPAQKSLAVVISSGTIKDSERYKSMLRTMRAEARGMPALRHEVWGTLTAADRVRFLEKIEPPAVLEGLFLGLAKAFRVATPAEDLAAARAMNADYSVLVDVVFPSPTSPLTCDLHFLDKQLRLVGSVQCGTGARHLSEQFRQWHSPELHRVTLGFTGEAGTPPTVDVARPMSVWVGAILKNIVAD